MSGSRYIIPEMYPQPKDIRLTGGNSDLATDIRLVTSNVLPVQRKAIRSILTSGIVKVIANKKKYVVDATVVPPETFDFTGIPEISRKECFQFEIAGSEVHITAPYQEGAVWASQALAAVFRSFSRGNVIPNLIVRDWPVVPTRGLMLSNCRGMDRMTPTDWFQVLDSMSAGRFNLVGVPLYSCEPSMRFENPGKPEEFVMTTIVGKEDLCASHRVHWYSATGDMWREEHTLPGFCTEGQLVEIINFATERGLTMFPCIDLLTNNTFFPRMHPELSAKGTDGNAKGYGFCLTSPLVRTFITDYIGKQIVAYYGNRLPYLHIGLGGKLQEHVSVTDPTCVETPLCECPECKKLAAKALPDFICWFVKTMMDYGVKKVVFCPDMLLQKNGKIPAAVLAQFQKEGILDHIVLDWQNHPVQQDLPCESWQGIVVNANNAFVYDKAFPTAIAPVQASGVMHRIACDPLHYDAEALLGTCVWEAHDAKPGYDAKAPLRRYAEAHFVGDADKYLKALASIAKISASPMYRQMLTLANRTACSTSPWPMPYPKTALDALEEKAENLDLLKQFEADAENADALAVALLEREGLDEYERDTLRYLRGEAHRILFHLKAFIWILELRASFAGNSVKKTSAPSCEQLHAVLRAQLIAVEQNMPSYMSLIVLDAASPLMAFVEYLQTQLTEYAGRKKANAIQWSVPEK